MANQIGAFFDAMPDRALAVQEVATHLRKFWEPRMRIALLAHVDATGGEGLQPLVRDAVLTHRAWLAPAHPPAAAAR
jgi:formate dehydrogenase subunit delta